ncbi:cellulose synthase complex periplasmic endoglucanase BcsZ [Terriglobus tenax]|uniref:cellulose synthase complex periplasmic endoglucanase BcsZ n=1 Tax=Terriglobus tenax TaxID=1111115 RepID=UPI0021E0284B|nr:cellulose synthase complex periplasmic endoglucanase BcsZ [Terriglobus tenax]
MRWRTTRRASACALLITLAVWFNQGCRAEQTWDLWEKYTVKFMDPQGRVIDHSAEDRTTSEGQAYGMFFALVAGDRVRFDKLLKWTEDNLAGGDMTLRLPAWNWGKSPEGQWGVLDQHPASDADLWMAYTLLEAGRIWRDDRYAKLGTVMAYRIAQSEVVLVPGLGTSIMPGPQGFHPEPSTYVLNPSYLPPFILVRLAKEMPQGPWGTVLDSLPQMLARGSGGGFAMDWVLAGSTGVRPSLTPAQLATGKNEGIPMGSYDAIRVYLWLGISDPGTQGLREMVAPLGGMTNYMRTNLAPPLQVDSSGKVLNTEAPVGFSAALAPYLQLVGLKQQAKSQMDRVTALKDPATGLYGRSGEYYDQNLAMFATGWQEQRFRLDRDGRLKLKWK